jgi:hypothetical protein
MSPEFPQHLVFNHRKSSIRRQYFGMPTMKSSVYIETTIISYLAAKPSRDALVLGRQAITQDWWKLRRAVFDLVISDLVLQEIQGGDADAANRRLAFASGIPALPVTRNALKIAEALTTEGPIPIQYQEDALHVALCAVNNIDFLLTWNCTHLANAAIRHDLESCVEGMGCHCPIICTPEELMEPLI